MADSVTPTTATQLAELSSAIEALKTALIESASDVQQAMQQAEVNLRSALENILTPQQAQQLIEQAAAGMTPEELQTKVVQVMRDLPDTAAFSHNLGNSYQTGTSFILNLSGVTIPSAKAVRYRLSNLVNLTAASNETSGTVTLTAGNSAGPAAVTITPICGEISAIPITLNTSLYAAAIVRPTINSPANDATDVALKPLISWSDYSTVPADYDSYLAAEVRVKNENGDIVWNSGELDAVTSTTVTENLPAETALDIEVRQKGSHLGWSEWSALTRVTTQIEMYPGAVMADGGICGPVVDGYQLIVAPKSKRGQDIRQGLYGTDTSLQNIANSSTPDLQSGYDNTNTLISGYRSVNDGHGSVGPAAALFCRALGSEWYLPNNEELKAIVDMSVQIDAADNSSGISFADLGSRWAWSSTEFHSTGAWSIRVDPVSLAPSSKDLQYYVIPVRRIPV